MAKQGVRTSYSKADLERVARMHRTTGDAARALGLTQGGFYKLCKRAGVLTPHQRKRKAG